jgi:hypothetical protein
MEAGHASANGPRRSALVRREGPVGSSVALSEGPVSQRPGDRVDDRITSKKRLAETQKRGAE